MLMVLSGNTNLKPTKDNSFSNLTQENIMISLSPLSITVSFLQVMMDASDFSIMETENSFITESFRPVEKPQVLTGCLFQRKIMEDNSLLDSLMELSDS